MYKRKSREEKIKEKDVQVIQKKRKESKDLDHRKSMKKVEIQKGVFGKQYEIEKKVYS